MLTSELGRDLRAHPIGQLSFLDFAARKGKEDCNTFGMGRGKLVTIERQTVSLIISDVGLLPSKNG